MAGVETFWGDAEGGNGFITPLDWHFSHAWALHCMENIGLILFFSRLASTRSLSPFAYLMKRQLFSTQAASCDFLPFLSRSIALYEVLQTERSRVLLKTRIKTEKQLYPLFM